MNVDAIKHRITHGPELPCEGCIAEAELDSLVARVAELEREVKRQEDEKWAAENRADEAEARVAELKQELAEMEIAYRDALKAEK